MLNQTFALWKLTVYTLDTQRLVTGCVIRFDGQPIEKASTRYTEL